MGKFYISQTTYRLSTPPLPLIKLNKITKLN
jgi:hypothetical protein